MQPAPFHDLLPRRPLTDEWRINARAYAAFPQAVRSFRKHIGYLPNIALPVTYNEKMFWRRIIDHDPAFNRFCDKLATRRIFEGLSEPVALPELFWTGNDPRDFPEALMRPGVVVKGNAGSRQNWFFGGTGADRAAFERTCRKWLALRYGRKHSQWGYRDVERKLFAEEDINDGVSLIDDLKVHLFSGEVYYTVIYRGEKTPNSRSAIFDRDGARLELTTSVAAENENKRLPQDYALPAGYGEAMRAAEEIARDTDYLRVDFMAIDGKLFGGEITPYPTAGHMTNSDPAVLNDMARVWDLRRSWFLKSPQTGWRAEYQDRLRAFVEAERAAYGDPTVAGA